MACEACEERRRALLDALFHAQVREAARHAITGAAEMAGLKAKEPTDGVAGSEAERVGEGDAGAADDSPPPKRSRLGRRNDANNP